ncbi:MAG: AAA family ATPase [Bifidobacterium aquikefiri]|uniref:AAA family ATPase n=2 Tax=Bifidobacterium aquikefiri TaxID=1653207 RepID=UPI0023F4C6DC|nr:AAA family ATPase [Bifidobacterium aquikefiri]
MGDNYQWETFYTDLAQKLLEYRDRRSELFDVIRGLAKDQPLMNYFHFEREDWWGSQDHQIDPFSVMAAMNRGTTDENRTAIAKLYAKAFDITSTVPTEFVGIPVLDNRKSFFAGVNEMWELFIIAMNVPQDGQLPSNFEDSFNSVISLSGNGIGMVSMALFWVRPHVFMPLETTSRGYIAKHYDIDTTGIRKASQYVQFLSDFRDKIVTQTPELGFPELSQKAWVEFNQHDASPSQGNVATTTPKKNLEDAADVPNNNTDKTPTETEMGKNIILYGTPGTGKTYSTMQYAVAIIEHKDISVIQQEQYSDVFARYRRYKEAGLIAFTTFHQSMGYEEFIEGIRPVLDDDETGESHSEISYEIHDGIFKEFCNKAGAPISKSGNDDLGLNKNPRVWKVSLENTGDNGTRTECLANGHIRIAWDEYGESVSDEIDFPRGGKVVLNTFYNRMQIGDIIFSCFSSRTIDAIGVITGDPEWHDEYDKFKRLRTVRWLATGLHEDIVGINNDKAMTLSTVYALSVTVTDAISLLKRVKPGSVRQDIGNQDRVFIIDEINRGNISKIFGELITLIETNKRIGAREESRAVLPYSGDNFGVPNNVYIIGTMNTADRSIALIDTALRRRFDFIEMVPQSSVLHHTTIGIIDLSKLLDTLNARITALLDREHTIGQAYFLPLVDRPSMKQLGNIMEFKIMPLLQEYFYDDYHKIQLILGDNQKNNDEDRFVQFVEAVTSLFGSDENETADYYTINRQAFTRAEAYAYLS